MNISSINKSLARYFQNHVIVDIKMTPVPTTAEEVDHLYRNFKTLGNLEFFRINRDKSRVALYDSRLLMAYNPSNQGSLLQPNSNIFSFVETKQELKHSQDEIINTLSRVIGLPRYSYVINDEKYWSGEIEVLFKYHLNKEGLKYEKKFNLTSSVKSSQFITTEEGPYTKDIPDFRKKIRHNFQKFHKFDYVSFKVGLEGINSLLGFEKLKTVDVPAGLLYNQMLHLGNEINIGNNENK